MRWDIDSARPRSRSSRRSMSVAVGGLVGALVVVVGAASGALSGRAGRADLTVRSLSSPPASVERGRPFTAALRVANLGTLTARRSTIRGYLSRDSRKSRRDVPLPRARSVPPLKPGKATRRIVSRQSPACHARRVCGFSSLVQTPPASFARRTRETTVGHRHGGRRLRPRAHLHPRRLLLRHHRHRRHRLRRRRLSRLRLPGRGIGRCSGTSSSVSIATSGRTVSGMKGNRLQTVSTSRTASCISSRAAHRAFRTRVSRPSRTVPPVTAHSSVAISRRGCAGRRVRALGLRFGCSVRPTRRTRTGRSPRARTRTA